MTVGRIRHLRPPLLDTLSLLLHNEAKVEAVFKLEDSNIEADWMPESLKVLQREAQLERMDHGRVREKQRLWSTHGILSEKASDRVIYAGNHLRCMNDITRAKGYDYMLGFANPGNYPAQLPDVDLSRTKPSNQRIKLNDDESLDSEVRIFRESQKNVVQTAHPVNNDEFKEIIKASLFSTNTKALAATMTIDDRIPILMSLQRHRYGSGSPNLGNTVLGGED
ncbi:hypothetical protein F5146DRAFT_1000301 [Armillaria mellea]|nr:hypothetical protein F5146DRAFT_1000301 [Armillaria mellea]